MPPENPDRPSAWPDLPRNRPEGRTFRLLPAVGGVAAPHRKQFRPRAGRSGGTSLSPGKPFYGLKQLGFLEWLAKILVDADRQRPLPVLLTSSGGDHANRCIFEFFSWAPKVGPLEAINRGLLDTRQVMSRR